MIVNNNNSDIKMNINNKLDKNMVDNTEKNKVAVNFGDVLAASMSTGGGEDQTPPVKPK